MQSSKDLKFTYRELKNKKDITIGDINSSCFIVKESKPQLYYIMESPRKKPRELKITDLRREFPMLQFGKLFNPIKAAPSTLDSLRLKRIELNNGYTKEELEKLPIKLKDDVYTYGIPRDLIDYDVRLLYALTHDTRTDERHKALCIDFEGAKYPAFFYFEHDGGCFQDTSAPMDYMNGYGSLGHKPTIFNMFKSKFISYEYDEWKNEEADEWSNSFYDYVIDYGYGYLYTKL